MPRSSTRVPRCLSSVSGTLIPVLLAAVSTAAEAAGVPASTVKGKDLRPFLSTGGIAAYEKMRARAPVPFRPLAAIPGDGEDEIHDRGQIPVEELGISDANMPADPGPGTVRGNGLANYFVNDPCLDPPPEAPFPSNFMRTVQSETEIAVLNSARGSEDGDDHRSGQLMVAGYNDSWGFYNNTQGLSGFAYSTDGGRQWIDGGGLPPAVKTGAPAGTPGQDAYFGDPVVVVHHRSKTFYYASIYELPDETFTIAVNRGHFRFAPPQGVESKSNTRCEGNPAKFGIPDPPGIFRERIIWEQPVVAVPLYDPGDFIDKEWLYVDQRTGVLYLAYLRFGADGSTPIELVRSFDGGRTWTPPTVIVPNLDDTINTGVQPITTPSGRVIVSWWARTFNIAVPGAPESQQRIEVAYSDNGGNSFGRPVIVDVTNPQGEPLGYNRGRTQIANMPYIGVDWGRNDGGDDDEDRRRPDYGTVYLTYFNGRTPFPRPTTGFLRAADIILKASRDGGATWGPRVKVNDDNTDTSHVFPSVQVNKRGTVFVTWLDRRVDPARNLLTDTWGAFSRNQGRRFGRNFRITNVSTDWLVRADAAPNFGDYNSSTLIDFDSFGSIWSDGRFPAGTFVDRGRVRRAATPDTLFAVVPDSDGDDGHGGNRNGGD